MSHYKILASICILFTFAALSPPASAQKTGPLRMSQAHFDRSYVANPHYDFLVRDAMLKMSPDFSFARLRILYSDTSYYDPLGDDTVATMQRLAYTIQTSEDKTERQEALDDYQSLVMMHMGSIRAVAQALSFAKLDGIFGSEKFFEWLRKGLVGEIVKNGDGKTVSSAYFIMTLTEETVLLGQLGLRVIETESVDSDGLFYNMHEVEDLRTGQKKTFFINTTRPMRFLKTKSAEAGGTAGFSILRQ